MILKVSIISYIIICFIFGIVASAYMRKISNILDKENMAISYMQLYFSYDMFKSLIHNSKDETTKMRYIKLYNRAVITRTISFVLFINFIVILLILNFLS